MNMKPLINRLGLLLCYSTVMLFSPTIFADKDSDEQSDERSIEHAKNYSIEQASWNAKKKRLELRGEANSGSQLQIFNAADRKQKIAQIKAKHGHWRASIKQKALDPIPCRIKVVFGDDQHLEKAIVDAPADCGPRQNRQTAAVASLKVKHIIWDDRRNALTISGRGPKGAAVTVHNAYDMAQLIGQDTIKKRNWKIRGKHLTPAPCRVAISSDLGDLIEQDVRNAPDTCAPKVAQSGDNGSAGEGNTGGGTPPLASSVSINSTSANALVKDQPMQAMPISDLLNPGSHTLLAANDLGMHCADLDYQIFSILPPFNVLHAQVIRRDGQPEILDDQDVEIVYSAVASNADPALSNHTAAQRGEKVYKSNFWEEMPVLNQPGTTLPLWYQVYSPLYFGLLQPADVSVDQGLPVPDSMKLEGNSVQPSCLTSADPRLDCGLVQALMPGYSAPFAVNDPQTFNRFDHEVNFFNGLLGSLGLGAVVPETNWFSAEGIALLPVDDSGRNNAYPLMRVQAIDKGTQQLLASTDVVLPVASEADCQSCHARALDCAAITQQVHGYTLKCDEQALDRTDLGALGGVMTLDGDELGALPPGDTLEQRLLNTAKINILRTHDAKHGTQLDQQRRVVCASCHYSPALDLAQLGPTDSAQTEQTRHISMSRAMHGHHGNLLAKDLSSKTSLFPDMPAPNDPIRSEPVAAHTDAYPLADPTSAATVQEYVLQQSCYSCHPGKRTNCLRGAMAAGGMVCQDCHGNMMAVGDDFSKDFPIAHGQMDTRKRVPWAVEPGCQSCHVGDATHQPTNTQGMLYADDSIRLLQAYRSGDAAAAAIRAPQSRFAENQVTNDDGKSVDLLYRLSKGHGGVMCEGCHGSTHAIWPNPNPNANDNIAANQIQGHAGVISECVACHDTAKLSAKTQQGPHGMHLVNDSRFWREAHKDLAERENRQPDGGTCASCHGTDHRGTVLSRTPVERRWLVEGRERVVAAGEPIGCDVCHSLNKSFDR